MWNNERRLLLKEFSSPFVQIFNLIKQKNSIDVNMFWQVNPFFVLDQSNDHGCSYIDTLCECVSGIPTGGISSTPWQLSLICQ